MKADDITQASDVVDRGQEPSRREFLDKTGRFAVVTPAMVAFLLTTSTDRSVAASGASDPGPVSGGSASGCDRGGIVCFFEDLFS